MVVCKFFQQGSCRYGQSCRFDHIYGSRYSYHATQPVVQDVITDEQLLNQVQTDIQSCLQGGQWLLSAYAPFKEKPNFPGLSDLSPEEARLFIYEAKASNSLDQAIAYFNNLVQDARSKHEALLQPTPNLVQVLRSLYKGEKAQSPFSGTQQNTAIGNTINTAASSVFRSAVQNNSVFGQTNPSNQAFGGQQSPSNIFGTASPENLAAKSIFAQASQNAFGNSQQAPSNPTSIFANASQKFFGAPSQTTMTTAFGSENKNVFAQNSSVFSAANGSSVFAPSQNQTPTNVFAPSHVSAQSSSVFGQPRGNVFEQGSTDDSGVYSRVEDLSADEIKAFENDDFSLGFIPEMPPPHSLCV